MPSRTPSCRTWAIGAVLIASSVVGCDAGAPAKVAVWVDPETGLEWQESTGAEALTQDEAEAYCASLDDGGGEPWRLPKIHELISLLRGCVNGYPTEGGSRSACPMTDPAPSDLPECEPLACEDCPESEGPTAGCYRAAGLEGECAPTWSATRERYVAFDRGAPRFASGGEELAVRCVRGAWCVEGSFTVASPGDADALRAYGCVTGDLTVNAPGLEELALPELRWVGGTLRIQGNDALRRLELGALRQVRSGYVIVSANGALEGLDGLSALGPAVHGLLISDNPALTSVDGLAEIDFTCGGVIISGNDALLDIDGLAGLESRFVTESEAEEECQINLTVQGNDALADIDALAAFGPRVDGVTIADNAALADLGGLIGIETVTGDLVVLGNASLASLEGLDGVTEVGWDWHGGNRNLVVADNPALASADGLGGLAIVYGEVRVTGNAALASLSGMSSLTTIAGGVLAVYDNVSLPQCEACALEDQLVGWTGTTDFHGNLADECDAGCP